MVEMFTTKKIGISFVMPVRNEAKHLAEAVEAVFSLRNTKAAVS